MKKILLLLVLSFTLFSCGNDDEPEIPQANQGRTVLAFFWADNDLNDVLRNNIRYMISGLQNMTKPAALVVYWDGKSSDANWPDPTIIKYVTDGKGNINDLSKEEVSSLITDASSSVYDYIGIGTVEKTYPSQTSTEKSVMRTVIADMMGCCRSESYGIVFGSHGSGWLPTITGRSIGVDGANANTARIPELAQALQEANPQKFDFVLFDACMMGSAEVYYELRNATKYCVASLLDVPGDGFPYTNILPYLYQSDLTAALKSVCDTYVNYYNRVYWGTASLVDCGKMEDLAAVTKEVLLAYQDNMKDVDVEALQEYGRERGFNTNFVGNAYDMVQYIETLCGGEVPADFNSVFNQTVLYTNYTPVVGTYCDYYQIDGDNYCGMGMYIPNALTDTKHNLWNNYFKTSIAWYRAAGWADTESIWGN